MSSAQRVRLENLEADLKKRGLNAIRLTADQEQDERDFYELLLHFGKVVRLQNHALRQVLVLHADSVSSARNNLRTAFPRPTTFTTGEARETLVTSRRVIVPLLEYFDQMGWTVRDGDQRSFVEM
jgi:selenocysteine-specific elongation factor